MIRAFVFDLDGTLVETEEPPTEVPDDHPTRRRQHDRESPPVFR
jgi:beta-phosphoglucomutase-like phosphatase (HAD superfamily)